MPTPGIGEIAFQLIRFGVLRGQPIVKRFAEHLVKEVGVQRGFLPRQVALSFEIGPADQDFLGGILLRAAVVHLFRFFDEEAVQHQSGATADLARGEEDRGRLALLGGFLTFDHCCPPLDSQPTIMGN